MSQKISQREQLRQIRKEKERKQRNLFIGIVIGIAVFLLAVIFLPQLLSKKQVNDSQTGFSLGDPNALVKVEEFSDFRCSYCKTFAQSSEPGFIKNYVDTGKVYLTFVNYAFLAADSVDAAEGAYCAADQNAFWQYKDILFTNNSTQDAFTQNNLIKYAKQLDLDIDTFSTCLSSDTHLNAIEKDKSYGTSVGVTGTPSFYVNGTLVYSNDLESTVSNALNNAN